MVVMENNVVHEGSMEMNGIPEGWTDLGNGLYSDENGDQVTEWVFDFMIRIIITTWDDYHLKFLDSKKRFFKTYPYQVEIFNCYLIIPLIQFQ